MNVCHNVVNWNCGWKENKRRLENVAGHHQNNNNNNMGAYIALLK